MRGNSKRRPSIVNASVAKSPDTMPLNVGALYHDSKRRPKCECLAAWYGHKVEL